MKKIFTLLLISVFVLSSCGNDGAVGPQGPPGANGLDGLDGLGYTFEETVTFDYFSNENLYSAVIQISDGIATEQPEADAVLVYRLEVLTDDNGEFDTWSLLPQNFFIEEGTIQYVYNHTASDVEVIIDGNFNLSNLDAGFTENQTFRVIVIPSLIFSSELDLSDMEAVMKALDIKEADVKNKQ
jgi:hypothetical protein